MAGQLSLEWPRDALIKQQAHWHAREVVKEFVKRIPALEVIIEGLHRDSSANKDGLAPENLRVAMNDFLGIHRLS